MQDSKHRQTEMGMQGRMQIMHLLYRDSRGWIRAPCIKEQRAMTAKEYLQQYKALTARVNVIEETIEQLRTEAESMSINLDGMPKGHSRNDKMERLAVKLAEYESELSDEMSALWSMRMDIIRTLGKLDHRHQVLLYKRYIEDARWEQIAYEMHITWRHCHRIHGRALAELEKIINEEETK